MLRIAAAACLVASATAAPKTPAQIADEKIRAALEPQDLTPEQDRRFKLHPSTWNFTAPEWEVYLDHQKDLNAKAFPQAPPVQCTPGAHPPEMCPTGVPCPNCGKPTCVCPGASDQPHYGNPYEETCLPDEDFMTAAYDAVAIHGGSMCSRECLSGGCPDYKPMDEELEYLKNVTEPALDGTYTTPQPSCSFGNDTMDGRATNCGLVCGGGCKGCLCPLEQRNHPSDAFVAGAKCFDITYVNGAIGTCLYPYEVDPCYEYLRGSCFAQAGQRERCLGCVALSPIGAKAAGCTVAQIHDWCEDR